MQIDTLSSKLLDDAYKPSGTDSERSSHFLSVSRSAMLGWKKARLLSVIVSLPNDYVLLRQTV